MMIIFCTGLQQDTVPRKNVINQESTQIKTDSVLISRVAQPVDSGKHKLKTTSQKIYPEYTDTISVCSRNCIADVTFYNSDNIITKIGSGTYKQFPFIFTEKARQRQMEERALLVKQLKPGKDLPANPLHPDWMILIIVVVAFLFSIVRATSKNIFADFTKFTLFRGINDPGSRDISTLYHWQSTIMNLISFFIIGLFGYLVVSYYDLVPSGFKGIFIWLIFLAIISSAITIRHITCIITGSASGERELFLLYLRDIYLSYRLGAFILFCIIVLMSYTMILPDRDYIITGLIILGLMYLIRVARLLIIFLNRNISIFYLILYLCALEILPVLIVVKYFTGLV